MSRFNGKYNMPIFTALKLNTSSCEKLISLYIWYLVNLINFHCMTIKVMGSQKVWDLKNMYQNEVDWNCSKNINC